MFTKISSLQPVTAIWCGDPTWNAKNFGFLKMSNFDICVVHLGFRAILGDPKFGPFHVGSPHHIAVTGYTWLTLVMNCNNEVCSPSILSRRHSGERKFSQNKRFPTVKGFTHEMTLLHSNHYQIKWCHITDDTLECISIILCLKVAEELHTRPYMVTKRRCVWTKNSIESVHASLPPMYVGR